MTENAEQKDMAEMRGELWEDVIWRCGHGNRMRLCGTREERERFVERAGTSGLCHDCLREALAVLEEAEHEHGRAERRAAVPATLPEIASGTEEENDRAEDARSELWGRFEERLARVQGHPKFPAALREATPEEFVLSDDEDARFIRAVFAIDDHRYWLDFVLGRLQTTFTVESVIDHPYTAEYLEAKQGPGAVVGT